MEKYRDRYVLVVNIATNCGLNYQMKDLEKLYREYKEKGLRILGFPCNQFAEQEKNSNEEIEKICELNYGVTFDLFQKIEVNGENAHPLYKFLKEEKKGVFSREIKWNFTKFLVDKKGKVIKRYSPLTSVNSIKKDLDTLID